MALQYMSTKPRIEIFSKLIRTFAISVSSYSDKVPEAALPKNLLSHLYSAASQIENGSIYDKKPFRLKLEKGKPYYWCLCGKSKSQPLCDGTHKLAQLKIRIKPVKFMVDETKEYWLCNCKQTTHRPFCDGTHKREDIQAAVKS